jgi:outer membrane protein OmpA-like peptidoglycan-associated protein
LKRFVAGALAALAALTACSRDGTSEGDPAAPSREIAADPASAFAGPVPAAPAASAGGGLLTGTVSSLTGEVSAFQTEVTDTSTIVRLAADVLFEFDSADLAPSATEQLRRTADLIRQGGTGDISVVGHTDAKGDEAYNEDLSRRRAQTVAAWLSSQGRVEPARLKASGAGEREPLAPNVTPAGNDDPSARARNRRVVLVIPRATR